MGGVAVNAPKVSDVTLDIDASFTQNKDSSGVDLPSPVSFIGTIMTDLDPIDITNNPSDYLVLPKTLTLTGQISDTQGNSMTETLAVNVTNTDTFNFVGEYAIGTYYSAIHSGQNLFSWSYSDTNADTVNDTFAFHNAGRLITIHWDSATNTADMSTPNTSASAGMISSLTDAINYFFFNYGIFDNIYFTGPNSASVWASEGVYNADQLLSADMTIDGSVDGYLTSPEFVIENATQWIEANIGLTFDLQLTGLPLASVNINADRTAFEEGKGAITIGYGNRQIAITVDGFNISNSTSSGSVKITNQDGVVVNLDNVTVSDGTRNMQGTLSYNGNQYGVIERTASSYIKVTYTDGTFEIF
jgi:hypothetical protein